MIVYVESNFILELAYLQEEHESCEEILSLAEEGRMKLVLPAYSVGEPYDSWVRRSKQRTELHNRLSQELNELSRSKPYVESLSEFQKITNTLVQSGEEEKERLDNAVMRVLGTAEVVTIERQIIKDAIGFQKTGIYHLKIHLYTLLFCRIYQALLQKNQNALLRKIRRTLLTLIFIQT